MFFGQTRACGLGDCSRIKLNWPLKITEGFIPTTLFGSSIALSVVSSRKPAGILAGKNMANHLARTRHLRGYKTQNKFFHHLLRGRVGPQCLPLSCHPALGVPQCMQIQLIVQGYRGVNYIVSACNGRSLSSTDPFSPPLVLVPSLTPVCAGCSRSNYEHVFYERK